VLLLSSAKMALETNLAAWSHYIQPETAMQQWPSSGLKAFFNPSW
jgi:hypothetical protein